MKKKIKNFREYRLERLKDAEYAQLHLNIALEEYEKDGDKVVFLQALRDLAEAQGGMTELARKTKLTRQALYKSLSPQGNPKLETIGLILTGLGYRLSIVPVTK